MIFNMKNLSITGIIIALFVGMLTSTTNVEAAHQFSDVKTNDYYYEDVNTLLQLGAISASEKFNPKNQVTRGQLAKMMAISLNLNTKNVKDPKFKDVPKKHQFYPYIAALANAGIIKGYANGNFGVNDQVKRSHLAKFVVEGFKLQERANYKTFSDIKVGTEADTYLKTLNFHIRDFDEVIERFYPGKDRGENIVKPSINITRAEVAMFVAKAKAAKDIQNRSVVIPLSEITPESIDDYDFLRLYGTKDNIFYSVDELHNELIVYATEPGKTFIFTTTQQIRVINIDVDEKLNISYEIANEALSSYKHVLALKMGPALAYIEGVDYKTKVKEVQFTDRTVSPAVTTTIKAKTDDVDELILYVPKSVNNIIETKVTYVDGSTSTDKYFAHESELMVTPIYVEVGDEHSVTSRLYQTVKTLEEVLLVPQNGQQFELIYDELPNNEGYSITHFRTSEEGSFLTREEGIDGYSGYRMIVKVDGIFYSYHYSSMNFAHTRN